jgi:sugar (pentulose or hexulose) kinase
LVKVIYDMMSEYDYEYDYEYYSIGIDIGTSNIKIVVIQYYRQQYSVVFARECKTPPAPSPAPAQAPPFGAGNVSSCSNAKFDEQDSKCILSSILSMLDEIDSEIWSKIQCVGVTGQMHGVVRWHSSNAIECVSNLITWRDQRCDDALLSELNNAVDQHKCNGRVSSGYGSATLAWLAKYGQDTDLDQYDRCSTIQDYIVHCLCYPSHTGTDSDSNSNSDCGCDSAASVQDSTLPANTMDSSNAASYGFFDFDTEKPYWNMEALNDVEKMDKATDLLPTVIAEAGQQYGSVHASHLKAFGADTTVDIPVGVAMGDAPAAMYAAVQSAPAECKGRAAVLSLGTSAVLSVELGQDQHVPTISDNEVWNPSIEIRPSLARGNLLYVVGSLSGGHAFHQLALFCKDMLAGFTRAAGAVQMDDVYTMLISRGLEKLQHHADTDVQVQFSPTFWGERGDTGAKASITGLCGADTNFDIGSLAAALARGIASNLKKLLNCHGTIDIDFILGNGGGLLRNKLLKAAIEQEFGVPVHMTPDADAAMGAALWTLQYHVQYVRQQLQK